MIAALAVVVLLALVAVPLVLAARRRRRFVRPDLELARQRIDELATVPPPDAIPRAPDLTKGQVRKLRTRRHPIAHKRSGRGW